jgi:CHASE2 domain-containing sensor protein
MKPVWPRRHPPISSQRWQWQRFLPEAGVVGAIALLRLSGALQGWEWDGLDAGLRLRPAEPMDDRVVILGIQESDIRGAGQYPMPDHTLARILTQVQAYQPAAIGIDMVRDLPVAAGQARLAKALQAKNVIVTEKALPNESGHTFGPPAGVPPEQVGFADAMTDADGKARRSLLGTTTVAGDHRLSLAVRLAMTYLEPQGLFLDNGTQDPDTMRFGSVELPRLHSNSGGYVRADAGGLQTLINFRSGTTPFRVLALSDLQRRVPPEWLRGKVVLIGYTAPSVKDMATSTAIATDTPSLVYGVEMQAHAVSQILHAVLEGRPLLRVWWDGGEYLWMLLWGAIGTALGRGIRSPLTSVGLVALAAGGLVLGCYGALLLGWWLPWVPALLGLGLNGVVVATFHRYDQVLRSRVRDRQQIIDQTFNTIHSGPLQTLAQTLRQLKSQGISTEQLLTRLEQLNRELRQVYDVVRQETLAEPNALYLEPEQALDLQVPLHQTLYEVYRTVLERDFPGFKTLRLKVPQFEPLDEQYLTAEQKRGLCRFLEEALCNVGKHAIDPTRLDVTCARDADRNLIRVIDNGKTGGDAGSEVGRDRAMPREASVSPTAIAGLGTYQAQTLAHDLGGHFHRHRHAPQGTVCELFWQPRQPWFRRRTV